VEGDLDRVRLFGRERKTRVGKQLPKQFHQRILLQRERGEPDFAFDRQVSGDQFGRFVGPASLSGHGHFDVQAA